MLQTHCCQPPSAPLELRHSLQVLWLWQGVGQARGGEDSTGIGETLRSEWLKQVQSYVGCTLRMRRVSPGHWGRKKQRPRFTLFSLEKAIMQSSVKQLSHEGSFCANKGSGEQGRETQHNHWEDLLGKPLFCEWEKSSSSVVDSRFANRRSSEPK